MCHGALLPRFALPQVRDAVFLHGYGEPVLALLHEAEPTWAGNLRQKVGGSVAGMGWQAAAWKVK